MLKKTFLVILILTTLFFAFGQENKREIASIRGITDEIWVLTNKHRKSIGKNPLERNVVADKLADEHSSYMIGVSDINHDKFNERFKELNSKVGAMSAGENVAMGQSTAEAVMKSWLNSPGHKKNIEGEFSHIGIAAKKNKEGRYYFTQIFFKK